VPPEKEQFKEKCVSFIGNCGAGKSTSLNAMLHPTRTPMGKFSTSWYSMIFGQEKERSNDLPCQETFS